ncbi:hypothetical protein HKD37_07G019453 [Glycine soja]
MPSEGPNVKTNPLANHGGASVNAIEEHGPSGAKRLEDVATSRRFIYQSLDECLFHLGESHDMETCPAMEELLQRLMDWGQLEVSKGGREEPQICMKSEEKKVPPTPKALVICFTRKGTGSMPIYPRTAPKLTPFAYQSNKVVPGNPYKYGLGYELGMPGRRNAPSRLRADRTWPGHVSQCFTSAGIMFKEEVAAIEEECPQDPPNFVRPCHPDSQVGNWRVISQSEVYTVDSIPYCCNMFFEGDDTSRDHQVLSSQGQEPRDHQSKRVRARQAFRKAYGKIWDLAMVEVSTEAIASLTQYYDQPLRCFTFGDFQLSPMALASGGSNLARLGELGGKLLPYFAINRGRSEERRGSAFLALLILSRLLRKIVSGKKIQAEALPFYQVKVKSLDVTSLKELGRLMGPLQRQAFRKVYGKILDLTTAEVFTEVVVSLAQYYDQPLRCFTFGDFQMVPTIEEFEEILGCPLGGRKPYLFSEFLPSLSKIAVVVGDSAKEMDRMKQTRNGVVGLPQKYLEGKARDMASQEKWGPFADILALLIFGVVVFPNVDGLVDLAAIDAFLAYHHSKESPVEAILADLFDTYDRRCEKNSARIVCCLPALCVWLVSHLFQQDTRHLCPLQSYRSCAEKGRVDWDQYLAGIGGNAINWFPHWKEGKEGVLFSCGDYPNVPLIGTRGCINYNPALAIRQLGYPMRGASTEESLSPFLVRDLGAQSLKVIQRVHKAWRSPLRKDKELRGIQNGVIGGYHGWLRVHTRGLDWLSKLKLAVSAKSKRSLAQHLEATEQSMLAIIGKYKEELNQYVTHEQKLAEDFAQVYAEKEARGRNHLVVAIPGRVFQPPYPKWYDPDAKCAYHSGAPRHNIDSCRPFKYKVQHLISAGWLSFQEEGPNVKTNPLASHGKASVNAIQEDGPSRARRLGEVATFRRFIYQSLQAACMVSRGGGERDECLFHLRESHDMETCPVVEELLQRFMDCGQLEVSIGGREEPQICMQSKEKKVPLTPKALVICFTREGTGSTPIYPRTVPKPTPFAYQSNKAVLSGFEPGMGLGKDSLGNADVVDIKGNPYKYGLGYEPGMLGRRNVPSRLRADRVWPGRISQCFTSAGMVSEEEVAAIEEEFPQDPPNFVQPCHPDSQVGNWRAISQSEVYTADSIYEGRFFEDPNDQGLTIDFDRDVSQMMNEEEEEDVLSPELERLIAQEEREMKPHQEKTELVNLGTTEEKKEVKVGTGMTTPIRQGLITLLEEYQDFGLGYKPTQADIRKGIAGRKSGGQGSRLGQEVKGGPPCHISRSFIRAGLGHEGQVVAICEDDSPSGSELVRPCPPSFRLGNWRVEERLDIYATSIM